MWGCGDMGEGCGDKGEDGGSSAPTVLVIHIISGLLAC